MKIGSLPDGTRGFDANARITPAAASAFFARGYRFAVRYVRRAVDGGHDLNAGELATLLGAGLGVMVVQHVALPGWRPSGSLGAAYGGTAAAEAARDGVPRGVHVWCDLEGVARGTPAADVIDFCNRWHERVNAAGYRAGLYVGDSAGLSGDLLYRKLKFTSYWSAYNLNADAYPTVRGVQMRQHAATPADLIPGYTTETLDVDVIHADALGGTPSILLPGDSA